MAQRSSTTVRRLTAGLLLGTCLSPCSLWAADFTVSTSADSGAGSLRQAIIDSNSAGGSNTIIINSGVGTITLTSGDLPTVANNATIVGNNNTLSGGGTFRGLFIGGFSGTTQTAVAVSVSNLTITSTKAQGSNGADRGGGGAGLGGALFVANQATLTGSNVTLSGNNATGGSGAAASGGGTGGGGGMGGNGAAAGGGGPGNGCGGGGGFGSGAADGNGAAGLPGRAGNATGGAVLDQANATATGDFNTVLNALSVLGSQQGPYVLNQISGLQYADFGTVNVPASTLFMNAVGQQLSAARGGAAGGGLRQVLAQACDGGEACDGVTSP